MAFSDFFFFLRPVNKIFAGSLWWVALMLVIFIIPFLRIWWWVFFPIFLSIELRTLYLWWINWDFAYAKKKWVMLEIVPPKEVEVPVKAMEDIFTVMWAVNYAPANWRERWCEGELGDAAGWMSWEIVSIEGALHFYIRVLAGARTSLETVLYGHYPELEIHEVPDYTRNVPQNIPNQEWDVYGEDFVQGQPAPYPIRTYEKFFEPAGEKISAEEKRIDPISSLLELLSKLGPGEQYWLQIITMSSDEPQFKKDVERLIIKLSKRVARKTRSWLDEVGRVFYDLVIGPQKDGDTYRWIDPAKSEESDRELLLTPAEREKLTEVENKVKRPVFRTNIRGVYVAKRENYKSAHRVLARAYFSHFQTNNLNFLRFSAATRPKTQYFFRKSIPFVRTRRQFRNYILRFTPFFPNRKRDCPLLNSEELATIYHFPLKITGLVAPTMARVESKKGGPPPNLPTE